MGDLFWLQHCAMVVSLQTLWDNLTRQPSPHEQHSSGFLRRPPGKTLKPRSLGDDFKEY
jgi:hypothetical protein